LFFLLRKARYYQAKDFGLINAAAYLIDTGKIKIYCPDSMDNQSWYNKIFIQPIELKLK
jgi:esterase/lipase superfamily enzyme